MKKIGILLSLFVLAITIHAQNFDDYFVDKALRLDYIFTGTNDAEDVALDQLNQLPQWAGRRINLSEVEIPGNGQINVYDKANGKLVYKESFSSLFQEWQTTDEAKKVKRSFENTYLVPYPRNAVEVEVTFRNKAGEYVPLIKHTVDPQDILIRKKGLANITPHYALHQGGAIDKSINVAIIAEGYAAHEMGEFKKHAQITCDAIFGHAPFDKLRNRFNFFAVESVSEDSGVAIPREGQWGKTVVSSHFDTFYSDRYLTTSNVKDLHDALAGVPYAHIIILANTDVYGGGGIFNAYTLTTTGHEGFKPVVVHEFGHSFAALADEYFYESDALDQLFTVGVEPWETNITALVDFESKWKDMLNPHTPVPTPLDQNGKYKVGVYEGAGYMAKGMYRPTVDCRMKTNTCKEFCPVCQRAIERLVNFYTEQKK